MGAWIEIPAAMLSKSKEIKVAPFMGAWIEISIKKLRRVEQNESHPLWVRGLKFIVTGSTACLKTSHPLWVRGLKF